MLLKTIVLAGSLALGGAAFAATPATPPGSADNPHPDSPTSLLRAAKQGSDASVSGNAGPVSSEPGVTAGTGKGGKNTLKKNRKRHATKPAA